MDSDPSEFPNLGHTLLDVTGPSESDRCKKIKGEAELFLEFIDPERMIPVWAENINWNAERFFHTGKTVGPYVYQQDEEECDLEEEDSRAQRVVYRLKWKPTN